MEKIKRIIKQIQAVQFNEGGIISSSGMRTLDNSIRELKAFETLAECVQDMPDCPEVDGMVAEIIRKCCTHWIVADEMELNRVSSELKVELTELNMSQSHKEGWKCTTCGSYFTRELKQDYCPACNHYAIEKI